MKSVSDLGELSGKRVLIRCDLNVPLDGETITDDGRIRASLPTLNELRDRGAKVIVLAHLGRPKGQVNAKYSLAPAAKRLSELLDAEVRLASDVVGESAREVTASLSDGEVGMLENVRYEPGEESKDEAARGALADRYAALGDVFVSDGFGVVHRKQASVYDIAMRLPNAAGKLVEAELEVLQQLVEMPARPVRGGARRREGLRQARGDREPDQDRGHPGHRRRHGFHLPRCPGLRGGQEPARAGSDRGSAGIPERRRCWRQADRAAL